MLKNSTVIKRKEDIRNLLRDFLLIPHRLETSIKEEMAVSSIIDVDKYLKINQFEPLFLNKALVKNARLNFIIKKIDDFDVYYYSFVAQYESVEFNFNDKFYFFSLPRKVKYFKKKYVIEPFLSEELTVSFFIDKAEYHRNIVKLTENEIYFDGSSISKSCHNKTLYNIYLKSVFGQFRFSGILKVHKENLCSFTDYLVNNDIEEAIKNYAKDNFIRKNNLHEKTFMEASTKDLPVKEKRNKVLIVDDSNTVTEILKEVLLIKTDYDVITTNNANDVLELVLKHRPFLLIIDSVMPEKNGIEVIKEIRRIEHLNLLKIMLLTLPDCSYDKEDLYTLDIENFIKKPVDPSELIGLINNLNYKI